MSIKKNNILLWILSVGLLTSFFFLKGVQHFLNHYSGNLAYIIEQFGLGFVAVLVSFFWLKNKHAFKLKLSIALVISLLVLVMHVNSFHRAILDEWFNIITGLHTLHYKKAAPEQTSFYYMRERYAWAPFTLFYEVVGFDKPYSNLVMSGFGILMIIGASLSGAWLAGIISKSQTAALIAGLLIGISPNTFASLPWPSSVQGDSLGIILVALTVGIWIVARRSKDPRGIVLSLLFLAASLKGGGSVRTVMAGALLIMTDIVLFLRSFQKKWLISWLGVVAVELSYYFFNKGVHMVPRVEAVPVVVRAAQIMELTTKSFVDPTLLVKIISYLSGLTTKVTWVVALGAVIFTAGWIFAIYCFIKEKWTLFTWGWLWFYLTVFYVPWFSEDYGATLSSINDRFVFVLLYAGYKYAYLPLTGLHVVAAIFLAYQIRKKKKLFIILTVILIALRSLEFLHFDYRWAIEIGDPNAKWQNMLFPLLRVGQTDPKNPKYLVLADGRNNPIFWQSNSVEKGMYYDGSVIFFNSVGEFFSEGIDKYKISPNDVYALGWDSGRQEMVNLTDVFRTWLKDEKSIVWENKDFSSWTPNGSFQNGFIVPPAPATFGSTIRPRESELLSPELNFIIPDPGRIKITLDINAENIAKEKDSAVSVKFLCNTDHGKTLVRQLVGWQRLAEDQFGESNVVMPLYAKSGNITVNGETKCSGVVLKKMIIVGSPSIKFRINSLQLSFPYPS